MSENTRMTPTGFREMMLSTQPSPVDRLAPVSVSVTLIPCCRATFSTPRMISSDHELSMYSKTSSMSEPWASSAPRRL
jgi:hypothetical protein